MGKWDEICTWEAVTQATKSAQPKYNAAENEKTYGPTENAKHVSSYFKIKRWLNDKELWMEILAAHGRISQSTKFNRSNVKEICETLMRWFSLRRRTSVFLRINFLHITFHHSMEYLILDQASVVSIAYFILLHNICKIQVAYMFVT